MTDFPTKRSLWASNIYCFKNESYLFHESELLDYVYDLKSRSKVSGISSVAKKNLFESQFNFFNSDLPAVQSLKTFCEESLMSVVKDVNGYDDSYMSQLYPDIRESWAHVTNNNGYHDAHKHLNTSWGGIYYLQSGECGEAPDDDGIIRMNGTNRFYSPIQYFCLDPSMQYLRHDATDICPEDGVLVIFPAYLLHSATPYSGEKDRVVISWNSVIQQKA